jgi:predicted MFS family arabinose efflux permease
MKGKKSLILTILGFGMATGTIASGVLIKYIEAEYLVIGAWSIIAINKTVQFYTHPS